MDDHSWSLTEPTRHRVSCFNLVGCVLIFHGLVLLTTHRDDFDAGERDTRNAYRKGKIGSELASDSPIELNPCPSAVDASNGPAEPHATTYIVLSSGNALHTYISSQV